MKQQFPVERTATAFLCLQSRGGQLNHSILFHCSEPAPSADIKVRRSAASVHHLPQMLQSTKQLSKPPRIAMVHTKQQTVWGPLTLQCAEMYGVAHSVMRGNVWGRSLCNARIV